MNTFKKILLGFVLLLVSWTILFMPFTIKNTIKYGKIIYYFDEYKLNKVKIDSVNTRVINREDEDDLVYDVFYKNKKLIIPFPTKALFQSKDNIANYQHFEKRVHYDWLEEEYHDEGELKNNSIWVFEHYIANDYYAKGKNATLDFKGFIIKLILNLVILLISLIAIYFIIDEIRYNKRKRIREKNRNYNILK